MQEMQERSASERQTSHRLIRRPAGAFCSPFSVLRSPGRIAPLPFSRKKGGQSRPFFLRGGREMG